MNSFRYLKYIFLTVTAVALTACGGGGANTSTIEDPLPPPSFSLAKIYSAEPSGLVYSTQLVGSSTDSATYTGSFSRTNQPKQMLNGVLVTPSEESFSITLVGSGNTQSFTSTTYIDSDDIHLSSRDFEGTTCTPASPEKPPILVNIDDAGVFPISTCSNGTSYEASWKVTDAGDGTIFHIVTGVQKEGNTIKTKYEETVNVDAAGFIVTYKSVTETIGGNIVTVQSL